MYRIGMTVAEDIIPVLRGQVPINQANRIRKRTGDEIQSPSTAARLRLFDRWTSLASMPATVMAKEGAGRRIVGAITLGAESGVAAFHRRISLAGRRRGRGQRGFRRGRASVQNVRIGMVECERAGLLNGCLGEYGCQRHRRQKRCRGKGLE